MIWIVWFNDWFIQRLFVSLIDWLIDWLLVDWLIDWLTLFMFDSVIDLFKDCLFDWLIVWLIHWLIYWLIDWLMVWLFHSLIQWLIYSLENWVSCLPQLELITSDMAFQRSSWAALPNFLRFRYNWSKEIPLHIKYYQQREILNRPCWQNIVWLIQIKNIFFYFKFK